MADDTDELVQLLERHTVRAGVMASPTHWAYHHEEGQWFAHCGTAHPDQPGCGWESKPHCYPTKEEARTAGMGHLADEIRKVFRVVYEPLDG